MSHPSPNSLNTAIIGAGYSGMAAAVTLAARGIPVTVFESAKPVGGRARGVYSTLRNSTMASTFYSAATTTPCASSPRPAEISKMIFCVCHCNSLCTRASN